MLSFPRNVSARRSIYRFASGCSNLYQMPSIRYPTIEDLQDINDEFDLGISSEDLDKYRNSMKGFLGSYERVNKLPERNPIVKYNRGGFYIPAPENNIYNAWCIKTNIKGAEEGILKGKTVAIKDSVAVAGIPMMNGSKIMQGYVPEFDATIVTRLLDAGANIVGKSNCENLCLSGNSFNGANGPVLNPHDTTCSAGGSSSGSAVLVTTKEVDIAVGGDQGGSIRLPACWSGCVGLKPTYGLVPYTGACTISQNIDTLGPLASKCEDVALMLEAIAGPDGLDCRQLPTVNLPKYSQELTKGVNGMKIGLVKEAFIDSETDVESTIKDVALNLKRFGVEVDEISIDMHLVGCDIWTAINIDALYHQMFLNGGVTVGSYGYLPTSLHDYLTTRMNTNAADLSFTSKSIWLFGEHIRKNYGLHYFCKANNLLIHLKEAYNEALKKYDAIVMPTIKFKATKLPDKDASLDELIKVTLYNVYNTSPFNATGHPALSINAGYSNKLPIGMQLVGKHYDDSTLLRLAYAVEELNLKK